MRINKVGDGWRSSSISTGSQSENGIATHPFIKPLHYQPNVQARILDDRYRVLMARIFEIRVVHGEDPVAHLQHIAPLGWARRDYVLDEDTGDFATATYVHLVERLRVIIDCGPNSCWPRISQETWGGVEWKLLYRLRVEW